MASLMGAALLLTACGATAGITRGAPTAGMATGSAVAPGPQRGIDLDLYWHRGMNVTADVTADAAYARRLGASAVMISFPFAATATRALPGPWTPPAAALGQAVAAARSQGLAVYARPLLDERDLGRSRVGWKPANVTRWLASYQALIIPYLAASATAGASGFYAGAELSAFAHDTAWAALDTALAAAAPLPLLYAANWSDIRTLAGSGGPAVTVTVDAYPLMPVPVHRLGDAWDAWAARLPRGTILSEVGIAARSGAQARPYIWRPSSAPLDPALQAAWFTAACRSVRDEHLGGIYFWVINAGQSLTTAPAPETANQFTDSPGAAAIKACFAMLAA